MRSGRDERGWRKRRYDERHLELAAAGTTPCAPRVVVLDD
jgi:hypothetical protein